jgi:DNA-binding NarL/FixJ family response regulator
MDVRMPIKSGVEATRDLLAVAPHARVLMLTGSPTPGAVLDSAQAGAVGLLLKGGDADLLIQAVRTVAAGGTAWAIEPATANGGSSAHRRLGRS